MGMAAQASRARARAGPGPLPLAPLLTAGVVGLGRAWGGGSRAFSTALASPMPYAYGPHAYACHGGPFHGWSPSLFWLRAVALLALCCVACRPPLVSLLASRLGLAVCRVPCPPTLALAPPLVCAALALVRALASSAILLAFLFLVLRRRLCRRPSAAGAIHSRIVTNDAATTTIWATDLLDIRIYLRESRVLLFYCGCCVLSTSACCAEAARAERALAAPASTGREHGPHTAAQRTEGRIVLQSQAERQSMPKRDGLERGGEDRKGERRSEHPNEAQVASAWHARGKARFGTCRSAFRATLLSRLPSPLPWH